MARVYATLADLLAHHAGRPGWVAPVEPNATRLLTRASREVDRVLTALGAWYDTDPVTLLPTETTVAEALRDAVCEQVGWWLETGDESGAGSTYQSVSIGSVSLTRGYSGAGSATGSAQTLSAAAVEILRAAAGDHLALGVIGDYAGYRW